MIETFTLQAGVTGRRRVKLLHRRRGRWKRWFNPAVSFLDASMYSDTALSPHGTPNRLRLSIEHDGAPLNSNLYQVDTHLSYAWGTLTADDFNMAPDGAAYQVVERVADPDDAASKVYEFTVDKIAGGYVGGKSRILIQEVGPTDSCTEWGKEFMVCFGVRVPAAWKSTSDSDSAAVLENHVSNNCVANGKTFDIEIVGGGAGGVSNAALRFHLQGNDGSIPVGGDPLSVPAVEVPGWPLYVRDFPADTMLWFTIRGCCNYLGSTYPNEVPPYLELHMATGNGPLKQLARYDGDWGVHNNPLTDTEAFYWAHGIYYYLNADEWSAPLTTTRTVMSRGLAVIQVTDAPGLTPARLLRAARGA